MSIKLLIDTDLGGDCDDVGAIALANILQNKSKTITLIVLTFIFALPLGVVYLVAYNKAKTSEV